jgi:hypothetical protein
MIFDLPPKLTEVRDICIVSESFKFTMNDIFILSKVEDWLYSNDIAHTSESKTINDGFFNRVHLSLAIPNDIQALHFKLTWL